MTRCWRTLGVALGWLLLVRPVSAQQGATITGRVTSEGGQPIGYATVVLEGMALGATTREDGTYSISVPAARVSGQQATLTVRAIGYRAQSRTISLTPGSQTQDFTLAPNPLRLGEVVVTGAGTQSAVERLGAVVSSVKAEEIIKSNELNTVQALAAKAPGVVVTASSGEPGASSFIQIRGQKSIEGTSQPLFVVDGIPVDNSTIITTFAEAGTQATNRMADLNPADIESVEILKGSAAAAIYGARAGAGVVLITTKRGRAGETRWSLRSTSSADKVNRDYPLQRRFGHGSQGNPAVCGGPGCYLTGASFGPELAPNVPRFNHFMEMFETGRTFDNTLSVSGGSDRATFYASLGHTDQDGYIIGGNDAFLRTTALIKGTLQLNDKLTLGGTINYADTHGSFIQKGSNLSGLLLGALRTPPEFDNRQYRDPETGLHRSYRYPRPTPTSLYQTRAYDNPFFIVYEMQNTSDVGRAFGNINLDYRPMDWLSFKYTLSADYSSDARIEALPPSNSTEPTGQIDRANYTIFQFDHNLIGQAEKRFNNWLNASLTLGQNLNSRSYTQLQVRGRGFIAPDIFTLSNTISSNMLPLDYESLVHLESYFAEAKLDLWDQLYLTAGARNDASSTFGKSVRRNWFPKASLAWEFSEFLGIQTGTGLLSYAKARAAYGETGREPEPYQVFSGFTVGTFGDGWTTGLNVSQAGNAGIFRSGSKGQERLKPERNKEFEAGLDLAFFDSKVDVGVTYYDARSTDVILSLPVPPSTGYFSQVQNAATITNKGWEVSANWRALSMRDLEWNVGVQWAQNRNLVKDLRGAEQFYLPGGFVSGIKEGYPHGIILGWDFVRCRYSQESNVVGGVDINAYCRQRNAPDGALYIDDGTLDTDGFPVFDEEQRVVGDPNPKWTGSINTSVNLWRKVQLSALVDIRKGGDIWNGTKGALFNFGAHKDTEIRGQQRTFGKDWMPGPVTGPGAGKAVTLTQSSWFQNLGSGFVGPESQFVEDGGFVKLREISISYTVTAPWVRRSGFSTMDLRLAGRNLWLKTDYTGIDPESNLGGAVPARGNEYFNNPQARSIVLTIGLNR
ncbi:MAG TPA: SusC/RagA family TonB-linked outer membrane protein [Gemmatimonadaceae bacterium]|nr:SusC/RagA family TonB-linked outer membrane protein [Gemmatimonadaceae bacterium]